MPFTVNWDNEDKTIIRITAINNWTWEEYHSAIEEIVSLANTVTNQVDVLIIDQSTAKMPPGSPIPHFTRVAKITPPNVRYYVAFSSNAIGKAMLTMYNNLPQRSMRDNFRMVKTLEEAYQVMAQHTN